MDLDYLYIYSKWATFTLLIGAAVYIVYHFLSL